MIYDLIIIGGGPAGYNAAERASENKMKTLLIEKESLGGVCLNEGCIPTKTLLYSAKIFDYAKHSGDYGIKFSGAEIDQEFIIKRKNKVVKTLVTGVQAKLKSAGVEVVKASAMIKGKSAEGFIVEADNNSYTAANLLICTGSSPSIPPIPGLKEGLEAGFCVTNREILNMTLIPKKFVIIGGGVIGLEFASYFNSVGAEVTVIEMLDHIAGACDSDITNILQKNYTKKGVTFKLSAKVTSIGKDCVNYEIDGKTESITADCVLVSIGRRANTGGFGLENINLLVERGAVVTDEYSRTNVAGVYAAGDVNGKSMLAHTAYREGEVAITNMMGGKDKKDRIDYGMIPSVIYTNPEVASIGETSESVKAKGLTAEVKTFPLRYSGRYIAENDKGDGIMKIIIDSKTQNIIGLHIIGNYASEIICGVSVMMNARLNLDDIKKIVFPHPTVSEIIREGIFMI